jgi:hypothetical protein
VCDDGFPWPGSVPPGWEYEWEDDSAYWHHRWPRVMLLVPFSILFPLCFKLWTTYLYVKHSVCIINLWRMLCNNLWLLYLWTRLRVSLMYNCRSCDVSDLPGLTRQRRQLLFYYFLMAKRSGLGNNMELIWAVLSQLASELHLYTRGLNTPLTTCFVIKHVL